MAAEVPDDVAKDAATWVEIAGYEARPLWARDITRRVVVGQRLSHCGLSHEAKCKIASIISSFESGLPACALSPFSSALKTSGALGSPDSKQERNGGQWRSQRRLISLRVKWVSTVMAGW